MAETLQHKFITVNGIRMHYVEQGKGELVLLLHGFPEFWYCWRHQIPELAKKYHVVAPDLRGYNETDKPKGIDAYSVEEITKDITALIKALGYEKATVIAHDWGGAIGWEIGIEHPELLNKLIIMNSPHPSIMRKNLMENPEQKKKSWYMMFFQIPLLPEFFLGLFLKKFLTDSFKGWAHNKGAFTNEDIAMYVKAMKKPGALKSSINWYRAAFKGRGKSGPKKPVTVPTLVIWGENDKALGKELTYGMERYITAPFDVKYISNCSHWVQNEYPEQVNEYILNFLA